MQYQYDDLRKIVGEFLGYGRHIDAWSTDEAAQVDVVVNRGYTQFLYPPPIDGRGKKSHQWRFLKPTTSIDVIADTSDYELPPGFERLTGPFYFETENTGWSELTMASTGQILALRQRTGSSNATTYPTHAAVQPKTHDGQATQRWEVLLWPTPGAAFTLKAQVAITPLPLSNEFPVPYGASFHSDTLLESCLSIAEQYLEDTAGVHTAKWKERLMASVDHDSRTGANSLGYNGNGSGSIRYQRANRATYNGVLYD